MQEQCMKSCRCRHVLVCMGVGMVGEMVGEMVGGCVGGCVCVCGLMYSMYVFSMVPRVFMVTV